VLIDAQGKVIGMDLHGPDLANALNGLLEKDPAKIAAAEKLNAKARKRAAKEARNHPRKQGK
jgi:hypothetical protein